jgi:hypothetical protein
LRISGTVVALFHVKLFDTTRRACSMTLDGGCWRDRSRCGCWVVVDKRFEKRGKGGWQDMTSVANFKWENISLNMKALNSLPSCSERFASS